MMSNGLFNKETEGNCCKNSALFDVLALVACCGDAELLLLELVDVVALPIFSFKMLLLKIVASEDRRLSFRKAIDSAYVLFMSSLV